MTDERRNMSGGPPNVTVEEFHGQDDSLRSELEAFGRGVSEPETAPKQWLTDAVNVMAVVDAVRRSARLRQTTEVDEWWT